MTVYEKWQAYCAELKAAEPGVHCPTYAEWISAWPFPLMRTKPNARVGLDWGSNPGPKQAQEGAKSGDGEVF